MADRIKVWLERPSSTTGPDADGASSGGKKSAGASSGSDGAADGADGAESGKASAAAAKKGSAAEHAVASIKLTPEEKTQAAKAQAAGLRDAAAKGVPFCEECERARQALAAQWRGSVS